MRVTSIFRNICSNVNGSTVIVDRFKRVSVITLNRPVKQNAFNKVMLNDLATALKQFEEDKDIGVAIINGAGGHFSVGYDIEELKAKEHLDADDFILPFQRKTSKPLICSVSGTCKSIGFEIALMCDIRFIETKTVFSFSNRRMGIPLINNGPSQLAKFIGLLRATEMTLLGNEINATEAIEYGLASEATPDGTALGSSITQAIYLSSIPQSALQFDLNTLTGIRSVEELKTALWPSISKDLKHNIQLTEEELKAERINKLKNRPDWELNEIEREYEYLAKPENKHLCDQFSLDRPSAERLYQIEIDMKKNHQSPN